LITADGPTLTGELAAISKDTGWHAWHSDAGEMYATHSLTRDEMHAIEAAWLRDNPTPNGVAPLAGSGVTVHAPTPQLLRYQIALSKHESRLAA
jgi:hypothetical protein